ncbi:cache domain-containing protein, partial [Dapis sp. BLCC M126]|uniref:cache domain-containing protein n=1 Tax=Dapis sp. BLCC M126 TaxID=3400189 RepID=UPI003CF1D62A
MFNKLPLKTVLIVSFILQIVTAVGLVGYFSFTNGRESVYTLANQLTKEISIRIKQHVLEYVNKSYQVLRVTNDAIESGNLDVYNFGAMRLYFWNIIKEGNLESDLFFGNEQGEFIGVELNPDNGEILFRIRTTATQPVREIYQLDNNGNAKKFVKVKEYDPRIRPWYQAAKQLGKPTWSSIYPAFSRSNTSLDISAVRPIFNSTGELIGVLANQTSLTRITEFLKQLNISPNGQSFIMERSGDLVVSSQISQPFLSTRVIENKKIQRLPAIDSNNITVSATAKYLKQKFGDFNQIEQDQQLNFSIDGVWHYTSIMPVQDGKGIDWLVVVVVPENDFMAQINANTRTTILLSLGALILAVSVGIVTTHWITKPILQLNSAAKEIAKGKWENTLKINRSDEVGELAKSFNLMTTQLKNYFETLEAQNQELKQLDRLKDEFLANTSHELRTPLNGIIGIGEFLLEGQTKNLNFLITSNLRMIVSSARRLSNLVNDILDFSKIRYNKLELQIKAVDVFAVVETVVTLNLLITKNKNLQLINAIPTNSALVCADENRLQQIFYNLISNAIKFTESGKVEISATVITNNPIYSAQQISVYQDSSQNQQQSPELMITVSDTGIGIPSDKLESIFKSFEQGDGSTARKYGGTGLGLAVTK